jgi:putative membrane protein
MRGGIIADGWQPETGMERITRFIVRWLITAAAVWVAAQLVSGIHLKGAGTTLAVALVLGLLNAYLKPLLVFGTFPLLIMSVGLFLIIVNTLLLATTAWFVGNFTTNVRIDGFWDAFWGAVVISVVSFLISRVFNPKRIARGVVGR